MQVHLQPRRASTSNAARASSTASAIGPVHSRCRARSWEAAANIDAEPRRRASANISSSAVSAAA